MRSAISEIGIGADDSEAAGIARVDPSGDGAVEGEELFENAFEPDGEPEAHGELERGKPAGSKLVDDGRDGELGIEMLGSCVTGVVEAGVGLPTADEPATADEPVVGRAEVEGSSRVAPTPVPAPSPLGFNPLVGAVVEPEAAGASPES